MTWKQPLRPSYWNQVRGRDLKVGDVIFLSDKHTVPVTILSPPKVIARGFAYLVGNWGFPEARLEFRVKEGEHHLTTLRVHTFALFNRPRRKILPRP